MLIRKGTLSMPKGTTIATPIDISINGDYITPRHHGLYQILKQNPVAIQVKKTRQALEQNAHKILSQVGNDLETTYTPTYLHLSLFVYLIYIIHVNIMMVSALNVHNRDHVLHPPTYETSLGIMEIGS
jgi:hypothetical protein